MLRLTMLVGAVATFGAVAHGARKETHAIAAPNAFDVASLLTSARGTHADICALAAHAIGNGNWGAGDVPYPTLASDTNTREVRGRDEMRNLDDRQMNMLADSMASPDDCVREMSVQLLGRQDADSLGMLIGRLTSGVVAMRVGAATALGLAESEKAVPALINATRDAAPDVRGDAAWALGRIGDGRALPALSSLVNDAAERTRLAVVEGIGRMESTSTVGLLTKVLRDDSSPRVRRVAAWALGEMESADAAAPLSYALGHDSDPRVREMAAWALGERDGRGGDQALSAALRSDSDERVRETAAWALGQSDDRSVDPALLSALDGDASSRVRATAAWAVGQHGDELRSAPAGLIKLLGDDERQTRLMAAWALGEIGDANAASAIHSALTKESDARVRRALVRALLKSGEHSEAAMRELLQSPDEQVRDAAVRGLAGREAFGPWPMPMPRPRPFPD